MPSFGAVEVFQVKPSFEEALEIHIPDKVQQLISASVSLVVHTIKRSHIYGSIEPPPHQLARIIGSVKYQFCSEVNLLENCHHATLTFLPAIFKLHHTLLVALPDTACGI